MELIGIIIIIIIIVVVVVVVIHPYNFILYKYS